MESQVTEIVVKYPREVLIEVRQEHIDAAVSTLVMSRHAGVCESCVIAEAARSVFLNCRVSVGITSLVVRDLVSRREAEYYAHIDDLDAMTYYTSTRALTWCLLKPGATIRLVKS